MRIVIGFSVIALSAPSLAGNLTPPPGPPASTFKTLDEVNPSAPINAAGFLINAPGAYHVTQNLEALFCGGAAIEITASNVTLDLGGFEISHPFACADGILLTGPIEHVTIRNGHLVGFLTGIGGAGARGTRVERISVTDCTVAGVSLGPTSVLDRVSSERNASGFDLAGSGHKLSGCLANDNTGAGFGIEGAATLHDCVSVSNGLDGFTVAAGPVAAPGASLTECQARLNGQHGFVCGPSTALERCLALSNSGDGFRAGPGCVLSGCVAADHLGGVGIHAGDGVAMTACTVRGNGVDGIAAAGAHCVIIGCIASGNIGVGIDAAAGSVIHACSCYDNSVSGIEAFAGSVISDCSTTGNIIFGIVADETLIRGCTSFGNAGAYGFTPNVTAIENHP